MRSRVGGEASSATSDHSLTRHSAAFALNIRERCYLSQGNVNSVVADVQQYQASLLDNLRDKIKNAFDTHTLGNNSTADSPTASDAGLIDPEQEVVSPLVPQPTSVLHCGSQCNLRPFHRSSGLQCISVGTFFRHQRLYTIPTIVQAWQNEQAGIIRELKEMGGGLILSGDCRSDSPGHCAKYGTYSLIEDRINKVLDLQLVQSSEVPSSTWCELEGLKRSIDFLKEQHMQVSALITDRNRQVAKWVREELCPGGTSHFFNIWHIGKSPGKALDAAAKERECEDLKLWRPAIINHLYWTAASTPDGDPDVMEAKWQSMVNHVQDIHEHGTPAFPCCAHPPLEGEARDKEWLVAIEVQH
ncbi:hypothetical protein JOQ06_028875, partial [Pogonophryne albipinna]